MTAAQEQNRAVVIGASIAGLLAARVLADHFSEVLVLERDALPERPASRKGTPQAVHPHGLLARGRDVMELLFAGFTDSLMAQGALVGDIGSHVAIDANRRRLAPCSCGIIGVGASRLAVEAELRRRVAALAAVRFLAEKDVIAPSHDVPSSRVTGVRFKQRHGGEEQSLSAGLVIDCTGRGSRSPAWLREWGYAEPTEDKVVVGISYTSAYFKRDPTVQSPLIAIIGTATPEQPRPYVLIAQEPDADGIPRWVVGVGGYAGDHPENSLEGLHRRALETGVAEIAALAEHGESMGPVMRFGFPHSQRRHYERLSRFPAGYLVLGDALASFNPIYGQGMTVAACEAMALREVLTRGTDDLAKRFFRAAAKVIDVPWQLAVGGDLALQCVPGPRPLPVRIVNAYIARLQRAAVLDSVVSEAFIKVIHLVAPPATLFAPAIFLRVMRGGARAM